MNTDLKRTIGPFCISLAALAIAVVRFALGYVPSSRIVKYDNITEHGNPVTFWLTIAVLLLIGGVFFVMGSLSAWKYLYSKQPQG